MPKGVQPRKKMIEKYSKRVTVCLLMSTITHNTVISFRLEISSVFSFYARELNLVSKCRQMHKLYSEIIKSRGKYGGKKKRNISS